MSKRYTYGHGHVNLWITQEDGLWLWGHNKHRVCSELEDMANAHLNCLEPHDITVFFNSKGYYLPMSMYGGPDNLGWPAEGEDERTLDYVEIDGVKVSQALAEYIFEEDEVFDAVQKEELDHTHEPEGWYDV